MDGSTSIQQTSLPISAKQAAVTSPTYPVPTMHMFITKKPFLFSSQGIAYRSKMIALSLKIELILFYVLLLDPGEMVFNFTGQARFSG